MAAITLSYSRCRLAPHQPEFSQSITAFSSAPQLLSRLVSNHAADFVSCSWCQRINRFQQISASFLAVVSQAILAFERFRIRVAKLANALS